MRRLLRAILALALVAILGIAATIASVEWGCVGAPVPRVEEASAFGIPDPGYKRPEGDSFMTYPEWSIVHAYADLAGVTRRASESGFDYFHAVTGFWSNLCRTTSVAASVGGASQDQRITNYVIGFSFTLEMALQGLYERTLGALTAGWRGPTPTAEDAYAQRVYDDYAAFLQQTPWYQFPFGEKLFGLWRETAFVPSVRSVERRVSLSLQFAGKSAYAAAIRYLAGYAPAELTIRSVVDRLDETDLSADPRILRIRDVEAPDGRRGVLIETPRYQALTEIVEGLASRQRNVLEIAGNRRILTTIVAPEGKTDWPGALDVFSLPIQSKPGWRRIGLDTTVPGLTAQIRRARDAGATFEHAYDY